MHIPSQMYSFLKTLSLSCFVSITISLSIALPFAKAQQPEADILLDHSLDQDSSYQGVRCSISNIQTVKRTKKTIKLVYTIANTGRSPIQLGNSPNALSSLIVEFDHSLEKYDLEANKESILSALGKENLRLKPGEVLFDKKLVMEVNENIENTKKYSLRNKNIETRIYDPVEKEFTLNKQQYPIHIPAGETADANPSAKDILKKEPPPVLEETNKNGCVDLVIDSIRVLKLTESYIQLDYTIRNKGTMPATIYGESRNIQKPLSVQFYFSGSSRLTRGSIFADGVFINDGLKDTKGVLSAGKGLKQSIKLSLEKKIRYYKVIVLEVDSLNRFENECDETNNVSSIIPEW